MQARKELCMKFPTVLRDKLLNQEIEFPDNTQFVYESWRHYKGSSLLWGFKFFE